MDNNKPFGTQYPKLIVAHVYHRDASPQRSPLLAGCMSYLDPPEDAESETECEVNPDEDLATLNHPIIR